MMHWNVSRETHRPQMLTKAQRSCDRSAWPSKLRMSFREQRNVLRRTGAVRGVRIGGSLDAQRTTKSAAESGVRLRITLIVFLGPSGQPRS